ncbi:hypothetical protein DPMN_025290 [Dreissena polymorpha]|uniref:Uncharacterized protein n=1 Tax=Dreissena polymorpha TaxID=45954 RepID=A0A9D4LR33_DREPO|nr:hypothetical protein DPMN_025290 [Dreissena polymorpha]
MSSQLLELQVWGGDFSVRTCSISVYGPVAAAAATRTIRTHAIIDRYLAEQQAVWSAGPRAQ